MKLKGILWLPEVLMKIQVKHGVQAKEVEEVLRAKPLFRRVRKGYRRGEDVYVALGRSAAGRYLSVFFIRKLPDSLWSSAPVTWIARRDVIMKRSKDKITKAEYQWALREGEHWDSHSLADVWDETSEVDFDVDLQQERFLIALEPELAGRLAELAGRKGVSPQTLVNLWVQERLAGAGRRQGEGVKS